jgi:hypothetical protein
MNNVRLRNSYFGHNLQTRNLLAGDRVVTAAVLVETDLQSSENASSLLLRTTTS